jgi:hypothetical protein
MLGYNHNVAFGIFLFNSNENRQVLTSGEEKVSPAGFLISLQVYLQSKFKQLTKSGLILFSCDIYRKFERADAQAILEVKMRSERRNKLVIFLFLHLLAKNSSRV